MIVANHNNDPMIPSHAKCIKAALNKEINNLSPLVVSKPNIPLLGAPPGTFFSHITIPNKQRAIKTKNPIAAQLEGLEKKSLIESSSF